MKTIIMLGLLVSLSQYAQAMSAKLYLASSEVAPIELTWPVKVLSHWDEHTNDYLLIVDFLAPENYHIDGAYMDADSRHKRLILKAFEDQRIVRIMGAEQEVLSKGMLHIQVSLTQSVVVQDKSCSKSPDISHVIKDAKNYYLKVFCDGDIHISGILNSQVIHLTKKGPELPVFRPIVEAAKDILPYQYSAGGFLSYSIHESSDFTNLGVTANLTHPFHDTVATHDIKFSLLGSDRQNLKLDRSRFYSFDSYFSYQKWQFAHLQPLLALNYRQIYFHDSSSLATLAAGMGLQYLAGNYQLATQASLFESGAHKTLITARGRYTHRKYFYKLDLEYFYGEQIRSVTFIPSMGVEF